MHVFGTIDPDHSLVAPERVTVPVTAVLNVMTGTFTAVTPVLNTPGIKATRTTIISAHGKFHGASAYVKPPRDG
jgi:hypothetical protein